MISAFTMSGFSRIMKWPAPSIFFTLLLGKNSGILSDQANATRLSKMAHAAMPVLETVIMTGVRIMISRGRV